MTHKSKQSWVSSLTDAMPLTPLDNTAPQNYIMRLFAFPFSSYEADQLAAAGYLKYRLARAFTLLPFLAGQVVHAQEGELPKLVYAANSNSHSLAHFPNEVFNYQRPSSTEYPWTYAQLKTLGFPAAAMTKHVLWLVPPAIPVAGDTCYPVTLKVTFIPGGLLLGFALHHGVVDGSGTVEFFKYFAGETLDGIPGSTLQKRKQVFVNFAAETAKRTLANPYSMDGYDFNVPLSPPTLPPAVAKIFTFSSTVINSLHQAALNYVRGVFEPETFVSRTDVLCGLAWLHVTRVRLSAGRIQPNDTTRFATAIDIRNRIDPPVGLGYIGNMWLRTLANARVSDLVQNMSAPAATAHIAQAALLIRKAIHTMEDPNVMHQHLAIATNATDLNHPDLAWPEVDAAIRRAIARHSTGVDASVGVSLGADVEFDIPGTGGKMKPEWVRREYVANDGGMNVMPRKNVTKGDADWEIFLALREQDMEAIAEETELGRYLTRPPA